MVELDLRKMLAMIRHRGPDEFGCYLGEGVGLGSARLSIIDLGGGQQPICNEDGTLWIVFNGEIFNYVELRPQLEARGHRFTTASDTEVLLHLYEEYGAGCLEQLNGQFAFAIWDQRQRKLFMARDRLGVRPLFYAQTGSRLVFGSEIKALLTAGVKAAIDPVTLDQVFTYWSPISPRTSFTGVLELPPGHYLEVHEGRCQLRAYWKLEFSEPQPDTPARSLEEYEEKLGELLVDATRIRLRADVPVGAYLSGGLDSSVISSIIRNYTSNRLDTFSIAFEDEQFDESAWQLQMAKFLGTEHQVVQARHADIGRVFPEVVWHTEVPLVRTAPAPMFLLSKLVRESGYKVVLTGEGADEFLAGYDIFKEDKVRRFWGAQPNSRWRPSLLKRLYPDIAGLSQTSASLLAAFFREGLNEVNSPGYSHAIRWRNGRRNARFFSEEVKLGLLQQPGSPVEALNIPELRRLTPLARAQYWEIKIFLSQYLLCSQGDRVGMAHSIEGRFPFLDVRLVEFCNRLPARLKLRGLTEKYLLRRLARRWLPAQIWQRGKRPYRAPIHRCFINQETPAYVEELLSERSLRGTGWFKPAAVNQLLTKARQGQTMSESDDMALAGILSTQLLHSQFVAGFTPRPPLGNHDKVKVCSQAAVRNS